VLFANYKLQWSQDSRQPLVDTADTTG